MLLPYQKFIALCFLYFTFILLFSSKFEPTCPQLPEKYQITITSEPQKTTKGQSFLAKYKKYKFLVYAQNNDLQYGDKLNISERPQALEANGNFLISTYDERLKYQGINGKIFIKEVVTPNRPKFSLGHSALTIKNNLSKIHENNLPTAQAQMLNSLLFGTSAAPLDKDTIEKYRRAGVIHLLVVSGSQIAILVGSAGAIVRGLKIAPLPAFYLISLFNFAFTFATGGGPSITRACFMAETVLFADLIGRKSYIYSTLVLSALIATLLNPLVLFDIGFQLSYAATIALVWLSPKIEDILKPRMPEMLAGLLSKSLAPLILTTPLCIYHFNQIAIFGLPVNMLILPWIEFIVLNGFAATLIGSVLPLLGFVLDQFNGLFLTILNSLVNLVNQPWATQTIPQIPLWLTICIYLPLWKKKFLLPVVLACLLFFAWPKSPEINMLNIGQGDCIFIHDGKSVLIDCGSDKKNAGLIAKAFLQKHGITKLDYLIITHEHSDHLNGLAELKAKRIITSQNVTTFETIKLKNSQLTILPRLQTEGNNGSLVSLLESGKFKAIFAGDLEKQGEEYLLSLNVLPKVNLLKVGHHGSKTSSTPEFIAKLAPQQSIISVGQDNRYKHPAAQTEARLSKYGQVYRTDRSGGIRIALADKPRIETVIMTP